MMAIDFLIVGGGIGGAVLANLLARAGKRVLVLEREATPPAIARPEVLWPATVQFLESILPGQNMQELALIPLRGLEVHYQQATLLRLAISFIENVGVQPWSSVGDQTRALLLREANCEIERGIEVVGLLKDGDRIVGVRARPTNGGTERDIPARWTVGDDGGHSIVRRECGISIRTRTLPMDVLSFGFPWPSFLEPGSARAWINPNRTSSGMFLLGAVPRPAGRGAGLVAVRPRLFQDERNVQLALEDFCAADRSVAEIIGSRRYPGDLAHVRLSWGHASRYGTAGAVLIGDAAHVVTPAGGQGANMAIADARVLAEVAQVDESHLVSEYERHRRPANERSMRLSQGLNRVTTLPDLVLAPLLPTAFRIISRFPRVFARGLRFASTAFLESSSR